MPGTITIRPLTANLTRDTEIFGTMDPYCKIILGNQKISGEVCSNGGKHPTWEDTIILKRINEPCCVIELKEKAWLLPDGTIGICDIDLLEVELKKRVLKWYPVLYENKNVGKLLLEVSYEPDHKEIVRDALPKNNVLNERVNQVQQGSTQEQQPKRGFLEGIIQGWIPFGAKAQQQPVEIPKQEIQAPPVQQIQHLNQPQNVHPVQNYDQNTYLQQRQVYPENNWAPSQQEENNYPQKYPQFSPQQSMNIDSGYRYPNPNVGYVQPVSGDHYNENREVYDYRNNQGAGAYGSGHYLNEYYGNYNPQQDNQGQASNKVDPLRVIRGL